MNIVFKKKQKVYNWLLNFSLLSANTVYCVELGTLFYTQAERVAIKQSRQSETGQIDIAVNQRYSGVVKRENGDHTVWINSNVYTQATGGYPEIQGNKIVLYGNILKVGDALDLVNGTPKEILPQKTARIEKSKK